MTHSARQPALYISHGGGPCFWMEFPPPIGPRAFEGLRGYLAGMLDSLPARPKAILVISAHWETPTPTVSTAAKPSMVFDYYGFPEHTYHLSYPAPGSPELAGRVKGLLEHAGIPTATDNRRGFDHGVFVPFLIVDPQATIPVVMLSLEAGLDPARHIAMGAALEPLRDEGVLIVGSGSSYHNARGFLGDGGAAAVAFDDWLNDAVCGPDVAARRATLMDWQRAPAARTCHPREEHLLPLMVAAGAAGDDRGARTLREAVAGNPMSCFAFGNVGSAAAV